MRNREPCAAGLPCEGLQPYRAYRPGISQQKCRVSNDPALAVMLHLNASVRSGSGVAEAIGDPKGDSCAVDAIRVDGRVVHVQP